MQYRTVLIGDEFGLVVLEKVIKSYENFKVKLAIVSEKRSNAIDVGSEVAERCECPLLVHPNTNDGRYEKFVNEIKLADPEIGIVYSYDRVLKREILDIFRGKIYNVHGALLPKYRGANALNWVLINDEKKTGVTIHVMTPEVDAGEIALQREVIIDERDTAVTLQKKLNVTTVELLHIFFTKLTDKTLDLVKQDNSEATVVKRRKPEDGFFSWDQDARSIYNLVRALVAPWPGAWYMKDGEKHTINYFISYDKVVEMKKKMQESRL